MAINWPDNPTSGQIHTEEGQSWEWDGVVWSILVGTSSGTLPPSTVGDAGEALVVNAAGAPEWAAPIDSVNQILDGGGF